VKSEHISNLPFSTTIPYSSLLLGCKKSESGVSACPPNSSCCVPREISASS
jgi:hypothetical protein